MVNVINKDHIDPYYDGDLRNLKHMMNDETSAGYSKHSYSTADQKRIYYIKLKKQMQREEQVAKQMENVQIQSESDSDCGKYKKKKKADKNVEPEEKKKGKKK
jgi:hypothetical protein